MKTIDKYRLVAELARGGMGVVYLAVTQGVGGFQKTLVIKELKQELAEDKDFVEMFLSEARLAATLQHPNVIQTYEVGIDDGRPYLVMDYLDGFPLVQIARRRDPRFDTRRHVKVLIEVLRGLEYLHNLTDLSGAPMKLVHRDMTPQNVFVTFDGQIKVLDFGIAKAASSSVETQAGVLKGKPAYMAPEQVNGHAEQRSDLFSVGVMLWEAIAGRRMWHRRPDPEILAALIQHKIPALSELVSDADAELIAIVDRAVEPNPAMRFPSAREMRLALEGWLSRSGSTPSVQEIGEAAAVIFAPERAARRDKIEQALKEIRSEDTLSTLPRVQDQVHEGTPSNSLASSLKGSSVSSPSLPPASPVPERRRSFLVQGLLLLLAFGAGGALVLNRRPTVAPTALAPVDSPAVSATAAAPAPSPTTPPPAATTASPVASAQSDGGADSGATPAASASSAPSIKRGKYVATAQPTTTSTATAAPVATAAPAAADCNPPFYFQGSKKIFKPGCL